MVSSTQRRKIIISAAILASTAILLYIESCQQRLPYHTSILTGEKWIIELISTQNYHHFYKQLGMSRESFLVLVRDLEAHYLVDQMRYMTTEEQVAIFLYTVVTNLSNHKVAERFQRSGETVSRYVLTNDHLQQEF